MASFGGAARDGRGKFREGVSAAPTIPLPTIRATAAASTAAANAASSVQLFSSIQSRPLQANPAAPFLWNSGSSSNTAQASPQLQSQQQQHLHRAGSATPSSASTSRSSLRGSMEGRLGGNGHARRGSELQEHRGGATTAHVVQPHKPEGGRASLRVGQGGDGLAPAKADRTKKATAVNYNALWMQQQQQQQQQDQDEPSHVKASPSPSPPPLPPEATRNGLPAGTHTEMHSLQGGGEPRGEYATTATLEAPVLSVVHQTSGGGGAAEGPLPPDVRRLIAQSCAGDPTTQAAAEQQARRLISTGRRVKVYREELAAAEEERRDWAGAAEQRKLVRSVLQAEVDDINARIQALLKEREICEAQLRGEDAAAAQEAQQLTDAEERVAVLRRTIDGIVEETVVPRLMLQQLVPSLLLENYI